MFVGNGFGAGQTELDNLTDTSTITRLSPEQRDEIKRKARSTGQKYIELPAKGVFTIKPSELKIRIVACGSKTDETFRSRFYTTDLDPGMMRYLVSWAASLPNFCLASLDVTLTILYKLNLLPPGHVWLIHKAIYGLREAPSLWSEERTKALTKLTSTSEGEPYSVLLLQIHRSLCLIVRQRSLQNHTPSMDRLGLTSRVPPEEVIAMSGIYVDDFLTAGPFLWSGLFWLLYARCGRRRIHSI